MKTLLRPLLTVLLVAAAVPALAAGAADDVEVLDPYVRAMPPGQPNTAAFMVLENRGDSAHAVVEAASPVSKIVELHTHIHDGGMMRMRQVERFDIEAGGRTLLQPGGLHIMLIELHEVLEPGTEVPVTLTFEDGSEKTVQAPVRHIAQPMMRGH
ncbi:copper chaperone PCu(A)C [Ectothiorhodospiraceae bacterium 2226]|nr:copper chaperone PCu(A)C [Ectothiorhodospiraceae bacterium 2226]